MKRVACKQISFAEVMQKRQMPVSQFSNGNGELRNVVQQRVIKAIATDILDTAVRAVDPGLRGSESGKNARCVQRVTCGAGKEIWHTLEWQST